MKIKLVSFFIDCGNQKYLKLCKVSEEINREYCKLHGYNIQFDYLTKQQFIDFYGDETKIQCPDYKVPYISQQLNKQDCDYLVFVDADAAVSNPNIKIEDLIDNEHQLFLSRGNDKVLQLNLIIEVYNKVVQILQKEQTEHYLTKNYYDEVIMKQFNLFKPFEWLSIGHILFNEGFIVVKNTQNMREFWNKCVQYQKEIFLGVDKKLFGMGMDGTVIKFLLLQQKNRNIYTFMPEFTQGGVANGFETAYNVQKTFILHNYGQALNIDQKIEWIESLKTNKWWKEILK